MTSVPTSVQRGRTPHPLLVVGLTVIVALAGVGIALIARGTGLSGSDNVLEGSGTAATDIREVPSFTSVDLAGATEVAITLGSEQRVGVTADDNLIELVATEVQGGELVIGSRGSYRARSPSRVDVTVPRLDAITLSGSGTVTISRVQGKAFSVDVPGSGIVRVSGATDRLEVMLQGSGMVELNDLIAARATAVVSGSGVIRLHATEALDATVSGSGTISYSGNPAQVTKNVTGSGAIIGG